VHIKPWGLVLLSFSFGLSLQKQALLLNRSCSSGKIFFASPIIHERRQKKYQVGVRVFYCVTLNCTKLKRRLLFFLKTRLGTMGRGIKKIKNSAKPSDATQFQTRLNSKHNSTPNATQLQTQLNSKRKSISNAPLI